MGEPSARERFVCGNYLSHVTRFAYNDLVLRTSLFAGGTGRAASHWLLTAALTWSLLAIGGVFPWTIAVAAILAATSHLFYLTSRRRFSRIPALLLLLGAALAITCFQLIPLPTDFVEILNPSKVTLLRKNAAALGEAAPSFTTLAYHWPATLETISFWAALVLIATSALRLAAADGRRRLLLTIGIATGATVVATAVHSLLGIHTLFGIYTPTVDRGLLTGPLINANHFSTVAMVCFVVCAGLAVQAQQPAKRITWGGLSVLSGIMLMFAASRGAALSLGLAIAIYVTHKLVVQRIDANKRLRIVLIGAAVLVGVSIIGASAFLQKSGTAIEPFGKLTVWGHALAVIRDNLWVGIGHGAFESVVATQVVDGRIAYTHVESQPLQSLVDFGLPATLFLLWLTSRVFTEVWQRKPKRSTDEAAWVALLALALHSFVEFGLSLFGIAALATVLIAATTRVKLRKQPVPLMRRVVVLVAGLAAAFIGVLPLARSTRAATADVVPLLSSSSTAAIETFETTWRRHPADHLAAIYVAHALVQQRDKRALTVAARAVELNPSGSALRLYLARLFASVRRDAQAAIEYKGAMEQMYDVRSTVEEVCTALASPLHVARAMPTIKHNGETMVRLLRACGRNDAAAQLAETLYIDRPGESLGLQWAHALIADEKYNESIIVASRLQSAERFAIVATAYHRAGQAAQALAYCQKHIDEISAHSPERLQLLEVGARTAIDVQNIDEARRLAKLMLREGAAASRTIQRAHLLLATIETRAGNQQRAAWHKQQAKLSPE